MVEAFQNVVMRLALCGLGVSLAAMALRSRPIRAAVVRLLAIWRGLTAFGRLAVCSFLLVGILVGVKIVLTLDLRCRPPSGNITRARKGQKMGDLINTEQWRIVIHESEEGGYWGEVPAMPGCASEGATIEECRANVIEAARGCLSAYLEMAIKRLVAGQEHKEVVFA